MRKALAFIILIAALALAVSRLHNPSPLDGNHLTKEKALLHDVAFARVCTDIEVSCTNGVDDDCDGYTDYDDSDCKKGLGESCSRNVECQSGLCRSFGSGSYCAENGWQCMSSFEDCAYGQYCNSNHRCEQRKSGGETCSSDDECQSFNCLPSGHCYSESFQCADDIDCTTGKCDKYYNECTGGNSGGSGGEGSPPGTTNPPSQPPINFCDSGANLPNGALCDCNDECSSGYCNPNGECANKPCTSKSQCPSGMDCVNNECVVPSSCVGPSEFRYPYTFCGDVCTGQGGHCEGNVCVWSADKLKPCQPCGNTGKTKYWVPKGWGCGRKNSYFLINTPL